MKHLLISFAIAIFCISAYAQIKDDSPKAGMIYGEDHAYLLAAPKGWVMDNQSGKSDGLQAVFYPEGSSWAGGAAVMYTNVLGKSSEKQPIKEIIDGDIADFKQNSATLKVDDAKMIDLGKGKSAVVKYFSGDAHGNFEAIAYIDEAKLVVIVVLSARNKKEFDASLPAFEELTKSYSFLTD